MGSKSKNCRPREPVFFIDRQVRVVPQESALRYDGLVPRRSFISEDPIGWASGQTNNYAYVAGNPIQFADPFGLKPGDSFCSMDAAAADALAFLNPRSIARNTEYATLIQTESHWFGSDTFTYNKIFENTDITATTEVEVTWRTDEGVVAIAHTHAAFRQPSDNYFSQNDKDNSDINNITNYVGTPGGNFYKYSPRPLGSPVTEVGATKLGAGRSCQ